MLISQFSDVLCWEVTTECYASDFELINHIANEGIVVRILEHGLGAFYGLFVHHPWKPATASAFYSIVCWNYLYLTRQLERAHDSEIKDHLLRLIASHSLMAWAHINMLGEYDFSEEKLRDTLGILPPKKAA